MPQKRVYLEINKIGVNVPITELVIIKPKEDKIVCETTYEMGDTSIYKKENIKQATLRKWQRTDMIDNIDIFAKRIIKNKKILLVDDVMTTGSTLSGAIKVIKKCNPKDIKILVLSKNEL